MFDISFTELLLIAVVALIVIGPEKLPKVARTLGALTGRAQRYIATVKAEVERELKTDELQKLHEEIGQGILATEAHVKGELREAGQEAEAVAKNLHMPDTQNKITP